MQLNSWRNTVWTTTCQIPKIMYVRRARIASADLRRGVKINEPLRLRSLVRFHDWVARSINSDNETSTVTILRNYVEALWYVLSFSTPASLLYTSENSVTPIKPLANNTCLCIWSHVFGHVSSRRNKRCVWHWGTQAILALCQNAEHVCKFALLCKRMVVWKISSSHTLGNLSRDP